MNANKNENLSQKIEGLNDLLSNYAIHYQNLRSMHWNVTGPEFFMLHEKFEEQYLEAQESVDEIAERILSLGGKPKSVFSVYLETSAIKEFGAYEDAASAIRFLVNSLEILIEKENAILKLTSESDDEGTAALMSDLIGKQEKVKWMFNASINYSHKSKNVLTNN